MNRRWLLWVWLFLSIEACLWLFRACRPFTDYQGRVDCSRPLLLLSYSGKDMLAVSRNGEELHEFEIKDDLTRKLEAFVLAQANPHVRLTRAGQLLDDHGRVILSGVDEEQGFVYDPGRDVLIWPSNGGLCIRRDGEMSTVRTWGVLSLWQIMPDGTIWVGEKVHYGGIGVVDTQGRFLGWRAKGFGFTKYHVAAEADKTVMPLVEKLLARSRDNDSKGF